MSNELIKWKDFIHSTLPAATPCTATWQQCPAVIWDTAVYHTSASPRLQPEQHQQDSPLSSLCCHPAPWETSPAGIKFAFGRADIVWALVLQSTFHTAILSCSICLYVVLTLFLGDIINLISVKWTIRAYITFLQVILLFNSTTWHKLAR